MLLPFPLADDDDWIELDCPERTTLQNHFHSSFTRPLPHRSYICIDRGMAIAVKHWLLCMQQGSQPACSGRSATRVKARRTQASRYRQHQVPHANDIRAHGESRTIPASMSSQHGSHEEGKAPSFDDNGRREPIGFRISYAAGSREILWGTHIRTQWDEKLADAGERKHV